MHLAQPLPNSWTVHSFLTDSISTICRIRPCFVFFASVFFLAYAPISLPIAARVLPDFAAIGTPYNVTCSTKQQTLSPGKAPACAECSTCHADPPTFLELCQSPFLRAGRSNACDRLHMHANVLLHAAMC